MGAIAVEIQSVADYFAMTDRSKRSSHISGILQLISFGFVGAATITLFCIASVSLLGTGKEPVASSHSDWGAVRYADDNPAPIPAQTGSPVLASAKLPLLPEEAQSTTETPQVKDEKPGYERPLPHGDASAATSEAARQLQGPPIGHTQSTEVSGLKEPPLEQRPIGEEVSAAPDPSQRAVQTDETGDQEFHNIKIQRNQSVKLDQDDLSSAGKPLPEKVQKQQANHHLPDLSPAFRSRVRKECGSITFPMLYRHCVASFGAHYR